MPNRKPIIIRSNVDFRKALVTNEITRDEADEWFLYLHLFTEDFVKKNHTWYVKKGYWPVKAKKKGAAEKEPKFMVMHHTSNRKGEYKPAFARFVQASKASSNLLISKYGDPIYMVDLKDMSYHATYRTWLPIDVRRKLGIDGKWINEPGFEVAGNGMHKVFSYDQIISTICTGRYTKSYYPSIEEVKSHRFFSRRSRAGDPGVFFQLPLIEHAIFNNIELNDPEYWVSHYRRDPVKFVNEESLSWVKNLGLEDRDEWLKYRGKRKAAPSDLIGG